MSTPINICARNLSADDTSLLKSIFALRREQWNWIERADAATWWVVDVDACTGSESFANSGSRVVLGIASDFFRMPHLNWTFISRPLRSQRVMAVLDHHLMRPSYVPQRWSNSEISLSRWPDIPRFKASPDLVFWCNELLHRAIPYRQLLAALPKQTIDRVIEDAERNHYLVRRPLSGAPASAEIPSAWRKLWSRWSR